MCLHFSCGRILADILKVMEVPITAARFCISSVSRVSVLCCHCCIQSRAPPPPPPPCDAQWSQVGLLVKGQALSLLNTQLLVMASWACWVFEGGDPSTWLLTSFPFVSLNTWFTGAFSEVMLLLRSWVTGRCCPGYPVCHHLLSLVDVSILSEWQWWSWPLLSEATLWASTVFFIQWHSLTSKSFLPCTLKYSQAPFLPSLCLPVGRRQPTVVSFLQTMSARVAVRAIVSSYWELSHSVLKLDSNKSLNLK